MPKHSKAKTLPALIISISIAVVGLSLKVWILALLGLAASAILLIALRRPHWIQLSLSRSTRNAEEIPLAASPSDEFHDPSVKSNAPDIVEFLKGVIQSSYHSQVIRITDLKGSSPTQENNFLLSSDGKFFSGLFRDIDKNDFRFRVVEDERGTWSLEYSLLESNNFESEFEFITRLTNLCESLIGYSNSELADELLEVRSAIAQDIPDSIKDLNQDIKRMAVLEANIAARKLAGEASFFYSMIASYSAQKYRKIICFIAMEHFNLEASSDETKQQFNDWVHGDAVEYCSGYIKRQSLSISKNVSLCDGLFVLIESDGTSIAIEEALDAGVYTAQKIVEDLVNRDGQSIADSQEFLNETLRFYCGDIEPQANSSENSPFDCLRYLHELNEFLNGQANVSISGNDKNLPDIHLAAGQNSRAPSKDSNSSTAADSFESLINECLGNEDNVYYVNVGEGPTRCWEDCRDFGFLAAGGGKKWSNQLYRLKENMVVLAYLKNYGYVGIGRVTKAMSKPHDFIANGTPLSDLPTKLKYVDDDFDEENGEYMVAVRWLIAVNKSDAAWRANSGLFTTALVCCSLQNQKETVRFVLERLLPRCDDKR